MAPFDILYEDDFLVAIHKPCGILVHRTRISEDKVFVLQLLRDQLGQILYPIHRLDRATSGVLIMAKDPATAGQLSEQFRAKKVEKKYKAIVRGFLPEKDTIDYPIGDYEDKSKPKQPAVTHYIRLSQSEVDIAIGRYPTSRFSMVEIMPETGRRHQIRRHFSHLRHPIIGDKRHGDVKHNKFFREVWGLGRMFLHAEVIGFEHPKKEAWIKISSEIPEAFLTVRELLDL